MIAALAWGLCTPASAQPVPFSSGPIPLCDTSTFTANVVGMGWLAPPGTFWSTTLGQLAIDITTDHPQTLRILLTSPQGTELLLSAFNGAGGQNYTGTIFAYDWSPSITMGSAPFTGLWNAQGGGLSVFDGEFADGIWTITVIDTACANGGIGPGGTWTPGWFNGSTANGGFTFGFNGPPPCWGWIPDGSAAICTGGTVDILGFYETSAPGYSYNVSYAGGGWVADPTAVTQPGIYYIDAFEPWSGCGYWASFEVIVSTPVSFGPDQVVDRCSGAGAMDLTTLFPLAGSTPMWSLDGTPITTATATAATAPGTYRLIGQNPGGCNDTALVTLNILPDPVPGPDQAVTACAGAAVDLTTLYTTGADATTWTLNGAPVIDPTAVTTSGAYVLAVTNASGCSATAVVTLNIGPAPALGPDQAATLCAGSSFDLTALYATSGLNTTWTLAGSSVPDAAAVNAAGIYTLVAADIAGCRDTAQVALALVPVPVLGADATITICAGTTVDLTALYATGADATAWTLNGAPVVDPTTVTTGGVHTLTATNASGCSATATVTLNVAPAPTLGPDLSVSMCAGSTYDLTTLYATTGSSTAWTFSGSSVVDASAVSTAGAYTLIATDGAGCRDTAQVGLTLLPAPFLGPDAAITTCAGTTVDLTVLYATGADATAWTSNGVPVADPTAVGIGGAYVLTVTNAQGCSAVAAVTLDLLALPALGADGSAAICPGGAFDLAALYPTAGLSTAWTLNGITVADVSSVGLPGVYTLVAMDPSGCRDTAEVELTLAPAPVPGPATSLTLCTGATVDLTALYATGADATAWTLNGVPVAIPSAAGVGGTYLLTITNSSGCSATTTVTLDLAPVPTLGADRSITICAGSTYDLTALYADAGPGSAWTLDGSSVPAPTSVNAGGTYQVVAINSAGCTDTAIVALTIDPGPALGADLSFSLCPWQTVDLGAVFSTVGLSASYGWAGQPVSDPAAISAPGTYTVMVTNANGCTDEALVEISNRECLCAADFSIDLHCMQEDTRFTLLADSAVLAAHWTFGDAAPASAAIDPDVRFAHDGTVEVTLQATLGCGVVEVRHTLDVEDCADRCNAWMPSAFTPDDDGLNDTWGWYGPCEPKDFSLQVFDRWGTVVFTSDNPRAPWDGTCKGEPSPPGVYAYRIGYRLPYQEPEDLKGAVTLVK
ncbi:MAG: gliding motility-associated C-terminal domain-containing protein [Bacteroidetes bacterium]|nr:gliding motility-associated C-terminal domain-containing protein [Bacteroidota bacterium]